MQAVSQLLQASLDPRQNKQAELSLRQEEKKPGFSLVLLQITATDAFPLPTRLASALCFKNYVKWNWRDEDGNYKLTQEEVAAIKHEVISLMVVVPPSVQNQLGEAISMIAESDFYEQWDTLIDDLVSRLTPDNAVVNNGVLQIAHSIFRRWRSLFRSDGLYQEINHVLSKFSHAFLALLQNTDSVIDQNQGNEASLRQYLKTLHLIMEIFYDISSQDIPPVAEENLQAISAFLHKYLTYDNPLLHTTDSAESGILEDVKVSILEIVILYTQKYEEYFGSLIGRFVETSWTLLITVGADTKYDILVSKALQFLTAVTKIRAQAESFSSAEVLSQVVEGVILPNVTLRDSDMELFEDEPIEFIRRDLEGSDSDTRRRAATDFLRQLLEHFEQLVTEVVSKYVNHYLSDYNKDQENSWKSKDTAVYLFSAVAAKGAITTGQGVQTTNPYTDIMDFFSKNIAGDLIADDRIPILKIDAIKYLYTFRSVISQPYWVAAFPLLVNHLGSSHYSVYTYASIAVERVLQLADVNKKPVIPREDVAASASSILQHLFALVQKEKVPEKIQENEFLMRCVMRVLITIREAVLPETDMVLDNFVNITREIQKNPSNPRFIYYHFEAVGALVRFTGTLQAEKLETGLYGACSDILRDDVQEFLPYVFQLFAAVLEASPKMPLSATYQSLVAPMLLPTLWESKGNVPALVRLLVAMVTRNAEDMVKNAQVEPLLGVFQKLVSSKMSETHGFELLEGVISGFPISALESYFVPMLQIMLSRLSNSKTENFAQHFVRFYHFLSARDHMGYGADFFIKIADQVQNDVFRPVYTTLLLPGTEKLTRPFDRKTAVISLTKTLADSNAFVERYHKGWALTCEALLKLMINPPTPQQAADIGPEHDVDDLSFGIGFTPLTTCKKVATDPFPDISDVKAWVGQFLKEADARHHGRITQYIQTDYLIDPGKF